MAAKEISPEWMERLEQGLAQIKQLPTFEDEFPFPWKEASDVIATALQIPDFQISSVRKSWKNSSELLQGMGDKVSLTAIEMLPVAGALFFALPDRAVSELSSQALVTTPTKEGFSQAKLKEGFYLFLFLKALQALDSLQLFKEASLTIGSAAILPDETSLCIDIEVKLPSKTLQARVVCPQSFIEAFKAHVPFQQETLLSLKSEVAITCEVGHTVLSQEEFQAIKVGDFVVLDRCSYDPSHNKGSVTLMLGKTPLVLARIKSEGVKILDLAPPPEETPEEGVTLTVEIEQLHLPLQTLLHLEPGALLDWPLHPEQGVVLFSHGKKIGQGELLKLGETLGVRVLTHG
jgi:flagellar motor switch protein FliN